MNIYTIWYNFLIYFINYLCELWLVLQVWCHPWDMNLLGCQWDDIGLICASTRLLSYRYTRWIHFSHVFLKKALGVVFFNYSDVNDWYWEIDNKIDWRWFNKHMEDMVNFLDVCDVFMDSILEVKKHTMWVNIDLFGLLHAHV